MVINLKIIIIFEIFLEMLKKHASKYILGISQYMKYSYILSYNIKQFERVVAE